MKLSLFTVKVSVKQIDLLNKTALCMFGLTLLVTSGCSNNTASSTPTPQTQTQAQVDRPLALPPALTKDFVNSLQRVTLPGLPSGVTIPTPDLRVAESAGGTRTIRSSASAGDAEVVGTVINGGGNYTGIYAQHTAYSATAFPLNNPSPAGGSQEVFGPLTRPTNGGCLVSGTVGLNVDGAAQNYTFFVVFDYCGAGAPKLVAGAQIDDPRDTTHFFKNNYLVTNNHGFPVYATLSFTTDATPTANSTWYMLLYNFKSNTYNLVFQDTGTSGTPYGYSVFESLYRPGACPSGLPAMAADYLLMYSAGTGKFESVAPTMAGTTSVIVGPSLATPCFLSDATGAASEAFTVVHANDNWVVNSAAASGVNISSPTLSFSGVGAPNVQTISVSEAGYTGAFTVDQAACANIATIAAGTAANSFNITPVAAGKCSATFTDSSNRAGTLSITVTTTTIGGT